MIFTTCDVDFAAPGRAGVDQRAASSRSRPASAPTRWARSASGRRAASRSRTATSPRTKARPWRSTHGGAAGETRALATDTVIVYFRNVVQAFEARWRAARRQHRRGGDLPVARRQPRVLAERRHPAERRGRRRDRHVDGRCLRRAGADPERPADARQQHADAELVGGRRQLLVHAEPHSRRTTTTSRTPRRSATTPSRPSTHSPSATRPRSRRQAAPAASSPGPAAIDGLLTALRRTGGSTNGARLAAQMEKFKNVTTLSGTGQLLEEPAHGVRPPVPGDPGAEQRAQGRRDREGEGRPQDLTALTRHGAHPRGGPGQRSGPPRSRAPSRAYRRSGT